MPNLASGKSFCTASARMWAAEWRIISRRFSFSTYGTFEEILAITFEACNLISLARI